ncbi:protein fuzzy homolog isoform X4 [Pectinophora gossypiella]|uniref:FUZ/MON1/HPS1 first Longin domain-containing protein n=1 Tax=Pectinophora gossypiella TaxID=13191 RepID=A0A1E1W5Y6_PECGO|nr:protein fuzzy homolog isoform X4 [Pectinophora gossypiella]XP_049868269.1 protein fuzzy homolog isoform X4 [Pectinophora gossypiella]XP_049868270.1 protein fuzzy homolog isoform X4 [Pectinophora gossypiella]
MSVIIIAVATESGVPIFSRKRGSNDGVQFSTIASLHSINMFSKCHNSSLVSTRVENGNILWKEYSKSVTLIGIATGGLECDLELLLSCVHDVMIFCIGKKELENLKNIDQIKRDLRQCYPILDYLLESLDPNAVASPLPTLVLDLIQSVLCPQAQQLQQALDHYAESVTGRWACLSIHGHLVATSSDFCELDPREARLMLLLATAQDGAPLRDTPVYLPHMSPNVAFRAVTCKLLADVYILVVCGATPTLSEIDEIVLHCWEGYAQTIKEAKLVYPRNFPMSIAFENCVLSVLLVNIKGRRCVFSRHLHAPSQKGKTMSGAHRLDILRTFYVTTARHLAPELRLNDEHNREADDLVGLCETYWCSEYHNCHAQRSGNLLCCVLYSSSVPTHTMRLITSRTLQDLITNKDIYW